MKRWVIRWVMAGVVVTITGALLGQNQLGNGEVVGTRPAATMMVPKLDHEALEKLGWRLSVQAYTFRAMSLYETIELLQKMGVRYIEMYPGQRLSKEKNVKADHTMPAELVEDLAAKLKGAGVTVVNYGVVGLGKDEASARKVFEFARKLRIETIVSEPGEGDFAMIDTLCEEYKINVAVHNHPKPSHYWDPATVLKVCEGRSKRIGACTDTGHWYRSGLEPVACIRKLEGRIVSMHLKDLSAAKRDVPWGTGVCDVKGVMGEIRRQGVRPVISIEYESTSGMELQNNVAKCCEYLSSLAKEMGSK